MSACKTKDNLIKAAHAGITMNFGLILQNPPALWSISPRVRLTEFGKPEQESRNTSSSSPSRTWFACDRLPHLCQPSAKCRFSVSFREHVCGDGASSGYWCGFSRWTLKTVFRDNVTYELTRYKSIVILQLGILPPRNTFSPLMLIVTLLI